MVSQNNSLFFHNFLPWFAGVARGESDSLSKHTRNSRSTVGLALLFGLFIGTVSFIYTMSTIKGIFAGLVLGTLWFFCIFALDRALIVSMDKSKRSPKKYSSFFLLIARLALALTLSYTNSEFVLMGLFKEKINEIVLHSKSDGAEKLHQDSKKINEQFQSWVNKEQGEITALEKKLQAATLAVSAEADGTGGSGQRNAGPIVKIKIDARDSLQKQLDDKKRDFLKSQISGPLAQKMKASKDEADKKEIEFRQNYSFGLIENEQALQKIKADGSVLVNSIFWILLILELSGFIAKILMGSDAYDEKKWEEELSSRRALLAAQAAFAQEELQKTLQKMGRVAELEKGKAKLREDVAGIVDDGLDKFGKSPLDRLVINASK